MKFRALTKNEIDVRVQSVSEKGCVLLLYKDARCDMNILDETVGPMNWQRSHTRDNANCIVSIWDEDKKQWVNKEDTGTESNTEKEKGQASDSFKRACFNWGIGRELYTAPFIWVSASRCSIEGYNGKHTCKDKFYVSDIRISENKIIEMLVIKNEKTNKVVFSTEEEPYYEIKEESKTKKATKPLSAAQINRMYAIGSKAGYPAEQINQMVVKKYNKKPELLTKEEYDHICNGLGNVAK